ncbi:hypothetical protein TSH100_15245 [Azospirillum sp. TSH100]|nr:hypothetical protein TSH100_15245 [Azospirillum sp. TSH100]
MRGRSGRRTGRVPAPPPRRRRPTPGPRPEPTGAAAVPGRAHAWAHRRGQSTGTGVCRSAHGFGPSSSCTLHRFDRTRGQMSVPKTVAGPRNRSVLWAAGSSSSTWIAMKDVLYQEPDRKHAGLSPEPPAAHPAAPGCRASRSRSPADGR